MRQHVCTKKEFILSPCVKKYEYQHFRFIWEYDMVGPPKIRNNGPSTCYSRGSAGKIGKGGEKSRTWRPFMGWVGAWGPDVSCRAGSRVTWLHPSRLWRAPHLLLWVTKSATSDPYFISHIPHFPIPTSISSYLRRRDPRSSWWVIHGWITT